MFIPIITAAEIFDVTPTTILAWADKYNIPVKNRRRKGGNQEKEKLTQVPIRALVNAISIRRTPPFAWVEPEDAYTPIPVRVLYSETKKRKKTVGRKRKHRKRRRQEISELRHNLAKEDVISPAAREEVAEALEWLDEILEEDADRRRKPLEKEIEEEGGA